MKIRECLLLFSLGLMIWISGTIYYAYAGHRVLETTPARYWVSFAISPIISGAFCILILRWRHVAQSNWAVAMLLLAIPGMVGEAVVLSNLGTFMPRIQEASGGRYGAFLFATLCRRSRHRRIRHASRRLGESKASSLGSRDISLVRTPLPERKRLNSLLRALPSHGER